jgi:hypothetical protein
MHEFALNTPELTERKTMQSYDCLGTNSAFLDTSATLIGVYSDYLRWGLDNAKVSMLGWGKMQNKIAALTEKTHI